jgi:hypothetical protein
MNSNWLRPSSEAPPHDRRRPPRSGVAITRIVNLPADWAELALQGSLAHGSGAPAVVEAGGSLHLEARVVVDDRYGPCRRLFGTLVSRRGWFRIPVELQLTGWSDSGTELTLRPRRSGRRPGWGRWYLSVGSAVIDQMVTCIGDPGCAPTPAGDRRGPAAVSRRG